MKALRLITQDRIICGPFAGLQLPSERLFLPILLGTYEKEIHPWLTKLPHHCPSDAMILNIGAGDGIYAVGLAKMFPGGHVLAFETQSVRQAALSDLAMTNGVSRRIQILGEFTSQHLKNSEVAPPSFVLIDIEGFEESFISKETVQHWISAEVIIETHDGFRPGNSDRLKDIFSATHHIDEVHSRPRSLADWPAQGLAWSFFSTHLLLQAMSEERPFPQSWIRMRPKKLTPLSPGLPS